MKNKFWIRKLVQFTCFSPLNLMLFLILKRNANYRSFFCRDHGLHDCFWWNPNKIIYIFPHHAMCWCLGICVFSLQTTFFSDVCSRLFCISEPRHGLYFFYDILCSGMTFFYLFWNNHKFRQIVHSCGKRGWCNVGLTSLTVSCWILAMVWIPNLMNLHVVVMWLLV